ncbi:hypothetical protein BGW38_005151 [Lunasporangiospora selenospora]|uniref:Uncharacterized protein n=1 Tax=Lunasporangiospora selenospora TaxID=979761 RepID=A0A9P6G1Y0_9FUNG|nr:hypothetical protein BGW38_005151 [Lunasporangiospora selenospora]
MSQASTTSDSATPSGSNLAASTLASHSADGFRPSIFEHSTSTPATNNSTRVPSYALGATTALREDLDSDTEDDFDFDFDSDDLGQRRSRQPRSTGLFPPRESRTRRRRRRRLSASAAHLLAQAPAVPDLRFDHNYNKALDQIYEAHAREIAKTSAAVAGDYTASVDQAIREAKPGQQSTSSSSPAKRVPSVAARITVMTIRDIIIMPFIHGFFWGFGTILLTLAGQRSLLYHLGQSWRRVFGGSGDSSNTTAQFRGEPARVHRTGTAGFGSLGLMGAGSQPGFGRPASS